MSLTNLTPHPIRVYGWAVPDRFEVGDHEPRVVLDPSGMLARIGQIDLGSAGLLGAEAPVQMVEYRHLNGLPPKYTQGWEKNTDWYVVSLPVALACLSKHPAIRRNDLLVPYLDVRNNEGTIIGCRTLALPV